MSHRLTIVIEALDRGGAEWHLLQVLPRLRDRNFDVEVFCLHHRGELAGEMERRGVRVIGTDVVSSNLFALPPIARFESRRAKQACQSVKSIIIVIC